MYEKKDFRQIKLDSLLAQRMIHDSGRGLALRALLSSVSSDLLYIQPEAKQKNH